jgi:hypothetical protein
LLGSFYFLGLVLEINNRGVDPPRIVLMIGVKRIGRGIGTPTQKNANSVNLGESLVGQIHHGKINISNVII